jgi:DNA-binding transcriptional ArsR family regulator
MDEFGKNKPKDKQIVRQEEDSSEALELRHYALKISEALYRTTDLMYDGEPLKWKIREAAIKIAEAIMVGLDKNVAIRRESVVDSLVKDAVFYLDLAASSAFISQKNFDVLCREYTMLARRISVFVEKSNQSISDMPILDIHLTDKDISDKELLQVEKIGANMNSSVGGNTTVVGNNDRRRVILDELKQKKSLSVSEAKEIFDGAISEKTVQRELASMVEEGLLIKEGEKRWRRYFLKHKNEENGV